MTDVSKMSLTDVCIAIKTIEKSKSIETKRTNFSKRLKALYDRKAELLKKVGESAAIVNPKEERPISVMAPEAFEEGQG